MVTNRSLFVEPMEELTSILAISIVLLMARLFTGESVNMLKRKDAVAEMMIFLSVVKTSRLTKILVTLLAVKFKRDTKEVVVLLVTYR